MRHRPAGDSTTSSATGARTPKRSAPSSPMRSPRATSGTRLCAARGRRHLAIRWATWRRRPTRHPPTCAWSTCAWARRPATTGSPAWDSPLPHVMIGRLPAATPADVGGDGGEDPHLRECAVDAAWRGQATLVADNAYAANGAPDAGGNFGRRRAQPRRFWPGGVAAERLYYNPCDAGVEPACAPPYATFGAAPPPQRCAGRSVAGRTPLQSSTPGTAARQPGPARHALDGGRRRCAGDRVAAGRLEMSCYTGFFHFPLRPALAEVLLRTAGGGAPSGVVIERPECRARARPAAGRRRASEPAPTLARQSWRPSSTSLPRAAASGDDLLDTFHLFGDPALQLAPPPPPLPPPPATTATPSPAPGPDAARDAGVAPRCNAGGAAARRAHRPRPPYRLSLRCHRRRPLLPLVNTMGRAITCRQQRASQSPAGTWRPPARAIGCCWPMDRCAGTSSWWRAPQSGCWFIAIVAFVAARDGSEPGFVITAATACATAMRRRR